MSTKMQDYLSYLSGGEKKFQRDFDWLLTAPDGTETWIDATITWYRRADGSISIDKVENGYGHEIPWNDDDIDWNEIAEACIPENEIPA